MSFKQKLENIIKKNNSLLCIGLDPDLDKIPSHILKLQNPFFEFNKAIIDATHNLVCAYKPNIAFYESNGLHGLERLKQTIEYLQKKHPEIPVILDAKRGDIGNSAKMYARSLFDYWQTDAVTVNPYLGFDAIEPFLKYKDKGIIILCRTSNPSASDFQDLLIYPSSNQASPEKSRSLKDNSSRQDRYQMVTRQARTISNYDPLYIKVAKEVVQWNQKYHNCLMVIGATWSEQLKKVREVAPEMFFLVPGIGTQGGDLKKTLEYGLTKNRSGLIVHTSSAIIYASSKKDFAKKARDESRNLRDLINKYRYE